MVRTLSQCLNILKLWSYQLGVLSHLISPENVIGRAHFMKLENLVLSVLIYHLNISNLCDKQFLVIKVLYNKFSIELTIIYYSNHNLYSKIV